MSLKEKINKKAIYATVAVISAIAGAVSGAASDYAEPDSSFYAQPYTSQIFAINPKDEGATRFDDMSPGDWFYNYVDTLVKKGIINGKSYSQYVPSGTLTVPECAALIVRCLGLEETAAREAEKCMSLSLAGSDRWYIGYMKVLSDAKVIPAEEYGFGYDKKGNFVMLSSEYESVPVKRCVLADFLYRMTMLDGSGVKAMNTYSERGGYGHEFIRAGLYDSEAVAKYSSSISDFEAIPEKYREGVLACYYNGIFNGDEKGFFNPEASLTRAEAAKVISVLTDISQRFGEDKRESVYVIGKNDTVKNIYGKSELRHEAGYRILEESASSAMVIDGAYIRLPVIANAPLGYTVEAHYYERSNGSEEGFERVGSVGVGTEGIYRSGDFLDFSVSAGAEVKILYLLRNTAEGGEVEGVLEMTLEGGTLKSSDGISKLS